MRLGLHQALVVMFTTAATVAHAQPAPDLARAKQLYETAQKAMAEGRTEDAIHDYLAAYTLSKDPALLYKLGAAHQKLGACEPAVDYYRRYLAEGKPTEVFVNLTRDRITQCGADPDAKPVDIEEPVEKPVEKPVEPPVEAIQKPVEPLPPAPPPKPPLLGRHRGAWLLVGGSIAMVTVGSVLAYSSNAAERDLEDLYVGLGGTPPVFDDRTRARYDDILAEGQRYETLSLVSFGLAGALAIGATVRFLTDKEPAVIITPHGAGATATLRF